MNNKRNVVRNFLLVLVSAFTVDTHAGNYFVDQKATGSNDQNPGTINSPWKTIAKANVILVAGDTVFIKAGAYSGPISPKNSGVPGKPITFKNFQTDSVTISDTSIGITLETKSYINIQGIHFYNLDYFLYIQDSSCYNCVSYCTFDQGRNMGWSGSEIVGSSSYNWIHHCRFSNYGYFDTHANGTVLDIGDEYSQIDFSSHNLIENNMFFHGGHHVLGVMGMYNVIRNNYLHNEAWSNGYGERVVYVNGYSVNSGWNLFEGNRIGYSAIPPANPGSSGMQISNSYNIVRRNSFFYNNLSGIEMSATSSYISDVVFNKIYHNTFLHNGWNPPSGAFCPDAMCSGIGLAIYSGSWIIKSNSFRNNIYYDHPQSYGYYHVTPSDQSFAGDWSGDTLGNPLFINASKIPGNPMDSSVPDVHLTTGSPCIDAATFLTTITSPSGSGTTIKVADSRFFMDGWGIDNLQGDEIQLFQSQQKAHITKIDYTTHTIDLDNSLTWTQNQGVCLAYEGLAPDIGAFEVLQSPIIHKNPGTGYFSPNKKIPIVNRKAIIFPDASPWTLYTIHGQVIATGIQSYRIDRVANGMIIASDKYGRSTHVLLVK